MKITKQARHDARQLFHSCVANGVMEEQRVRQAVTAVLNAKPRGYLAVLAQFERLVKLELARRSAKVESAAALSPQYKTQLQSELTRRYGAGLDFTFTENPALLGGARVQVGGDVYDGSVMGRLNALQNSFKSL